MRLGRHINFILIPLLFTLALFFNNCSETDFVLPEKVSLSSVSPESVIDPVITPPVEVDPDVAFLNSSVAIGLVGMWFLDEEVIGSALGGSDFEDSSGNGNHGIAVGAPLLGVVGKINKSLQINNNNQESVTIPDSGSLDVSLAATFSIWVFSAPSSSAVSIFEKVNTDNDPSFMLYLGEEEIVGKRTFRPHIYSAGALSFANWKYGAIDYDIVPLEWHHVVYSYDSVSGTMKGYINGLEYPIIFTKQPSPGDQIRQGTAPLLIGQGTRNSLPFSGLVDEMAIWNRVLSPEEVQALFLRGNPN